MRGHCQRWELLRSLYDGLMCPPTTGGPSKSLQRHSSSVGVCRVWSVNTVQPRPQKWLEIELVMIRLVILCSEHCKGRAHLLFPAAKHEQFGI